MKTPPRAWDSVVVNEMAPRFMSPMTTLSRWPWILRRSFKSRGGLFTRSGSEADPLMAERLPVIANAENHLCNLL
jgi:hypothetical protein